MQKFNDVDQERLIQDLVPAYYAAAHAARIRGTDELLSHHSPGLALLWLSAYKWFHQQAGVIVATRDIDLRHFSDTLDQLGQDDAFSTALRQIDDALTDHLDRLALAAADLLSKDVDASIKRLNDWNVVAEVQRQLRQTSCWQGS